MEKKEEKKIEEEDEGAVGEYARDESGSLAR